MNSKLVSFENGKKVREVPLGLNDFQAEALSVIAPLIEKGGVRVRLKSNISDFRIESSTVLRCADSLSKHFGIQVVPAQLFGHRTVGDLLGFIYQDSYRAGGSPVGSDSARWSRQQSYAEPQSLAAETVAEGISTFDRCEILKAPSPGMPFLILLSSGTAAGLSKIKKGMLGLLKMKRNASFLAALEYQGVKADAGMPFREAWVVRSVKELESNLESSLSKADLSNPPGPKHGAFSSFFVNPRARSFLGELFRKGELESLVDLWKQGFPIDWSEWYPETEKLDDAEIRGAFRPRVGSSGVLEHLGIGISLDSDVVEGFGALEGLSLRFCAYFLQRSDAGVMSGKPVSMARLRKGLTGSVRFERFFRAIISTLESNGWIRVRNEDVHFLEGFPRSELALSDLKDECRKFGARYSQYLPHVELLLACVDNTFDILKGRRSAVETIFPDMSMRLVERVYNGNALSDYYNRHTGAVVRAEVERILRTNPRTKVNVLEIGAGTGGTSSYVFDDLKGLGANINYQYTDIAVSLVQYGKETYGGRLESMEFKLLNIEKDPLEQGFEPGAVDIVLSANAIHATSDIVRVLGNVRKLMKDSGTVVLNEVTHFHIYSTLTFGLLDGWWLFEDEAGRIPHSPLLTFNQWERAFEHSGFCSLQSALSKTGEPGIEFQDVLVAKCAV